MALTPQYLIDYSLLLEQKYLYPYWQHYYKDINLSFVTPDHYNDLISNRSDDRLTILASKEDFVSFCSKS